MSPAAATTTGFRGALVVRPIRGVGAEVADRMEGALAEAPSRAGAQAPARRATRGRRSHRVGSRACTLAEGYRSVHESSRWSLAAAGCSRYKVRRTGEKPARSRHGRRTFPDPRARGNEDPTQPVPL